MNEICMLQDPTPLPPPDTPPPFLAPPQEALLHAELDIYEQFALQHCHVSRKMLATVYLDALWSPCSGLAADGNGSLVGWKLVRLEALPGSCYQARLHSPPPSSVPSTPPPTHPHHFCILIKEPDAWSSTLALGTLCPSPL